MRRISRLRPVGGALTPQCACTASPATLPISTTARFAAPLTTTTASNFNFRKLLLGGGDDKKDATKALDPSDAEALQKAKQERLAADLADAEQELAQFEQAQANKAKSSRSPKNRLTGAELAAHRKRSSRTHSFPAGPPGQHAPTPEAAKELGYTPALSGKGLEEMGGAEGWWERPGHWGPFDEIKPFSPWTVAGRVTDSGALAMYLRQAVFEVISRPYGLPKVPSQRWGFDLDRGVRLTTEMFVEIRENGRPRLLYTENDGSVNTKVFVPPGAGGRRVKATPEPSDIPADLIASALENISPKDQWKEVSLKDPVFAFAIAKRFFYLTGHRVHDGKLVACKTVGDLVLAVTARPKPTKVAEAVRLDGALLSLPNIKVYDRRVTPIDKEKEVGRWKVIEEELKKRDLPITGHKHLTRPKERDWILGKA